MCFAPSSSFHCNTCSPPQHNPTMPSFVMDHSKKYFTSQNFINCAFYSGKFLNILSFSLIEKSPCSHCLYTAVSEYSTGGIGSQLVECSMDQCSVRTGQYGWPTVSRPTGTQTLGLQANPSVDTLSGLFCRYLTTIHSEGDCQ